MHDDLLDAVDWAVREGIAPRDKVCIMAASYGGYAALVGLTFTPTVFACGVDVVGPSNLITLLNTIPPYWEPGIAQFTARAGDHRTEEGRKFLEIPRPFDYLVVVDVLLFIANIGMTIWAGRRNSTTAMVLYFGLLAAALLYLPGMIDTHNQTVDSFWRWWVVHLWVEGVWELIIGAILAFRLIKLTGVDREIVEKWLYVIVGFTFLSGILGTGHHYYFIGTPRYWLIVGGVFSALEPLAFLGMAIYAFAIAKQASPCTGG